MSLNIFEMERQEQDDRGVRHEAHLPQTHQEDHLHVEQFTQNIQ